MARTAWHPAFAQAIENELEDNRDDLTFETEYQLTTEPLRIDVLVIKKKRNVVIKKNIAKIFRSFNIFEYKSPDDSATIEAYHKSQCYGRLYAALNKVDINEMSVSVVVTQRPRKLLAFLRNQYSVQNVQPGIYVVEGDTSPTQVLVSKELSEEDNFWLTNLRNDLTEEQMERVIAASRGRASLDAYIYAICAANIKTTENLVMKRKNGVILSEKLDAYFTERLAAPLKAEGKKETILDVLKGRFGKVPKTISDTVNSYSDLTALQSLSVFAGTCKSLDEFADGLR